jgi:Type I phosphodiesterase / nucleotide pyrophosphatase
VIARTRLRYFFALWLVAISLAWAAFGSKGVQAVASSPLRLARAHKVPPLPLAPKLRGANGGADNEAASLVARAERSSSPRFDSADNKQAGSDVGAALSTGQAPGGGALANVAHHTPTEIVVVVSIDGLRPDVITPSLTALHRLYLQGASARVARTIDKSATLPSHASMVRGVDSDEHGLDFNAYRPERGAIARPTMFSVAHAAGLPTYMFVGKSKLKHLLYKPNDAELTVTGGGCKRLVKDALPQLQTMKRGLLFMHFADPDSAGHRNGWMSDQYIQAAQQADECLAEVMSVIETGGQIDKTLLIVTSDHGGHGRSHGTRMEVDQRIPWYAWGSNARRGRMQRHVHTTDTAATALAALGLKMPEHIQGTPVNEAMGSASVGPVGMPLVGDPVEPE